MRPFSIPPGKSDIDGRVTLSLTYVQVGMMLGALSIVANRLNGASASLAQIEINALLRDMREQIDEQMPNATNTRPAVSIDRNTLGN